MTDILFDSKDSFYKVPFGAVSTRQKVYLRLLVKYSCNAAGVSVFVLRHEYTLRFDLSLKCSDENYGTY